MKNTDLQDNITWLLLRATMSAKQHLVKVSESYDLTFMQAYTLCLLKPGETVAMSLISDLLGCDPSNVTGIVERLQLGAYIERRECRTDRRVKTINLTGTGIKLRHELMHKIIENETSYVSSLSQNEIETLRKILLKTLPTPNTQKHYPNA